MSVDGDVGQEVLDGVPHLLEAGHLAEQQGDVQDAEGEEEGAGQKDGEAAFQDLRAQDLVAAVGCHEEHVALAGVHVPVQGGDALHADQEDAQEGQEYQGDHADGHGGFVLSVETDQVGDLGDGGDRQDHQFGCLCFAEFVFH